nr:hypothetical protein [Kineococcus rhizosphaerae]
MPLEGSADGDELDVRVRSCGSIDDSLLNLVRFVAQFTDAMSHLHTWKYAEAVGRNQRWITHDDDLRIGSRRLTDAPDRLCEGVADRAVAREPLGSVECSVAVVGQDFDQAVADDRGESCIIPTERHEDHVRTGSQVRYLDSPLAGAV